MHPQRELDRLAARKAVLLRELDRQRDACSAAAARLVRPWGWAELVLDTWRHAAPVRPTPVVPRSGETRPAGSWLRWASLAIGATRLVLRAIERRPAERPRSPDGVGAED
jgi:hypothetical protein